MKRTKRKSAPQGVRYAVEFIGSYAHVFPATKLRTGKNFRAMAIEILRPTPQVAVKGTTDTLPGQTRIALGDKAGGNLPEQLIADLERALSAKVLKPPNELSTVRRMLSRKYKALVGHLRKVQEILTGDDLFLELDMFTTLATVRELLTEGERRRVAVSDCSTTGESFRDWEMLRRRRVAGMVLSVLETGGVKTGGPRAARVMEIVMSHFFDRTLDDPKRAMARYRKWWKGLTAGERDALLSRVRSGLFPK